MSKPIPGSANVVIIGGGIIGCSVAYHLTKLGVKDVVLFERRQLTCGTTWHAAGLITTLRATENQTWLAKYTRDLYERLEEETGQATGFSPIGSIQVASTAEKVEEMRRGCDVAASFGVESMEISPSEVKNLWPLANVDDVLAGFHFPHDGRANPTDTTQALARGARLGGAKIFENTCVGDVLLENGRVVGVKVAGNKITADVVVNCTGMWAREVGLQSGVAIPLQAAEHYYLVTDSIEGISTELPILRDPGKQSYYREETGKLMIGLFEDKAAAWDVPKIPEEFCFDDLPPDWERLMPYLETAMERVPISMDSGIQLFFCGPESFTPDHNYIMGQAPNVDGYFVAAGFNSLGILSAGGAGKALADWIVSGYSPRDFFDSDIRRFLPHQNNSKYLKDRVVESLGIGYQYHWPYRQWETARGAKRLLLHDKLIEKNACMGEGAGWERPNWYAPDGEEPKYEYSYGRQNWFDFSAEEHRAVRESVGVFELSSFSKFLVQGRDAAKYLNWICTNEVDVPNGRSVYTQWLNERGTIEADLTVTRLEEDSFLVVTAAFTYTHVFYWLKQNIRDGEFVTVTDVTTTYGVLSVQGPSSRALLEKMSGSPLSNEIHPFGWMRDIDIGYATVKALRISYVGELGWELYIPSEYLAYIFDELMEAGDEFGLRLCGYHALNSLRLEKAFREWGHDIGSDDDQRESGLMFAAKLEKAGGFLGAEALQQRRNNDQKLTKRLVQFLMKSPEPLLYHNEPILCNGERVGYTSSAAYGHTLGGSVALGYVRHDAGVDGDLISQSKFEIVVAGVRHEAHASLKPMYDPSSLRTKG
ncbi:sarcosine dehydrogenase [Luminiphilus syltensis NOR5-1B]|uniref:Sarcosine dehydrogenase n=1 Tax=Luminiphilus syltensis NOR5-1B TaxID=565045 RepID=B8KY47_9GAMM|nr:FAD-dependent oxidoreductase [Luminiphilus syltensis]EED35656.1 sarcosine dehydrogenase [Luminiphilus syltensis NOR5-1B]